MKVLSLFDGMACGALALQAAGIEIESYDAFEIDKYAIKTSSHNFPFIKHHGDVFKADFTQFEGIDLVCGGSPCTKWSIAQTKARETQASGEGWEWFQQFVRAIKEAKPKFFIYENNKSMSKAIRQSIDEAFGFEAVLINSALVSAQNRQRLYWVGRRNKDGTYSKVNVEQPIDRGILLKNVLDGVTDRTKARAVIGSIGRTTEREYFIKAQGTMTLEPVNTTPEGKSQTIKAQAQQTNEDNIIVYAGRTFGASGVAEPIPVCVAQRGRYADSGNRSVKGKGPVQQFYEARADGKTNTLTTVQKDNAIAEPVAINTTDNGDKSRTLMAGYYKYGTATLITNEGFKGGTTAIAEPVHSEPVSVCHIIPQKVRVRKYTCDIGKFQTLLRDSKKKSGLTNKDIAKKFNRPQTEVEHWFRTDKCFSIPDAEIWDKLKDFLNIETTEYDAFVTVFEVREGVFEKSERCYDITGKMSTIMTGKTDNIIEPLYYATPIEWDEEGNPVKAVSGADGKTYRVHEVKNGQITIKGKQYPIKLADGFYIIRKLTVTECKRLQTVPEWYEFPVSDSQAYKMLGNGWTVEVIAHLIKSCLSDNSSVRSEAWEQIRLF